MRTAHITISEGYSVKWMDSHFRLSFAAAVAVSFMAGMAGYFAEHFTRHLPNESELLYNLHMTGEKARNF